MKMMFGASVLAAALAMPVTAAAGPVPTIDLTGQSATLLQDAPDVSNAGVLAGCPDACPAGAFTNTYAAPVHEDDSATPAAGAAAVPEPGAWGMLLAGSALLGLTGRRRANEKFT